MDSIEIGGVIPKHILDAIKEIENGVELFESNFADKLSELVKTTTDQRESAKVKVALVYAISSLLFVYFKTQGTITPNHPVLKELKRVQLYMKRLSGEVELIEQSKTTRNNNQTNNGTFSRNDSSGVNKLSNVRVRALARERINNNKQPILKDENNEEEKDDKEEDQEEEEGNTTRKQSKKYHNRHQFKNNNNKSSKSSIQHSDGTKYHKDKSNDTMKPPNNKLHKKQ
jgi:hypothetical protein